MKRYKDFFFDASYRVTDTTSKLHQTRGHSYRVRLTCEGTPDPQSGLLADFSKVSDTIAAINKEIDHVTLNGVEGLENPTMENISIWIWNKAKTSMPSLSEVGVFVDTLKEACIYNGPSK